MTNVTHLPLPEPPDEAVSALLVQLRMARREMEAAGHTAKLIEAGRDDALAGGGHTARAFAIEALVAERRCELWAARIRDLEEQAARTGLRP